MRLRVSPTLRIAAGLILAVLLGVVGYHVLQWRIPGSSEALLEQADEKSWVNNWIAAEPLYRQAELGFIQRVTGLSLVKIQELQYEICVI